MSDDTPETFRLEDLIGPQTILVLPMLRFNKIYEAEGVEKAVAAYDEDHFGPRFMVPSYNASIVGAQSIEDILRYRVWYKSRDREDPLPSQYEEYRTLEAAMMGRAELIEDGYFNVDMPLGVVWDNAIGCFAECRVKELGKITCPDDEPESEESEEKSD